MKKSETTQILDSLERLSSEDKVSALLTSIMLNQTQLTECITRLLGILAYLARRLNSYHRTGLAEAMRDCADSIEHLTPSEVIT